MKHPNDQKLFTFVEKNANQQTPSATLTSALYSIIFSHNKSSNQSEDQLTDSSDDISKNKQHSPSRSQSQSNLTTSIEAGDIDGYPNSCLRSSCSSVRQKGDFGLHDWFFRSGSHFNSDDDIDSQSLTNENEPSVNFHNFENQHNSLSNHHVISYKKDRSTRSLSSIVDTTRPNNTNTPTTSTINRSILLNELSSYSNSSRISIDNKDKFPINKRSTVLSSNSQQLNKINCTRLCKSSANELIANHLAGELETNNQGLASSNIINKINVTQLGRPIILEDSLRNESDEDDWILVGVDDTESIIPKLTSSQSKTTTTKSNNPTENKSSVTVLPNNQQRQSLLPSTNNSQFYDYIELYKELLKVKYANAYIGDIDLTHFQIMALDMKDIDLIRESWKPVRKDIVVYGIALFRDLFTKFPSYKQFFTNIPDLDLERMHENKRLLKHATKVIETVSFVVDSVGDETKANDLNEALLGLVKGHLKRRVGTLEFKNLGIVLVDFICNVNNQRGTKKNLQRNEDGVASSAMKKVDEKSSLSLAMVDESATMTDALDKLRKLSSSATSLTDDNTLKGGDEYDNGARRLEFASRNRAFIPSTVDTTNCYSSDIININNVQSCAISSISTSNSARSSDPVSSCCDITNASVNASTNRKGDERMPLDTNSLVAAWTKLYGVILGLVEREEMLLQEQIQPAYEAAN